MTVTIQVWMLIPAVLFLAALYFLFRPSENDRFGIAAGVDGLVGLFLALGGVLFLLGRCFA